MLSRSLSCTALLLMQIYLCVCVHGGGNFAKAAGKATGKAIKKVFKKKHGSHRSSHIYRGKLEDAKKFFDDVNSFRKPGKGWLQPRYSDSARKAQPASGHDYDVYDELLLAQVYTSVLVAYTSDYNYDRRHDKGLHECGLKGKQNLISDGGQGRTLNVYCRRVVFPFSFQTHADPCLDDCKGRCEERMHADMANVLPNDDAKLNDKCQAGSGAYVKLYNHQWLGFKDGDQAATCACMAELVMMRVRKRSFADAECDVCNVQNKITAQLNKSDLSKFANLTAADGTVVKGAWPWMPTDYPVIAERNVHCGSEANNCWGDHQGYPQGACDGKGVYS